MNEWLTRNRPTRVVPERSTFTAIDERAYVRPGWYVELAEHSVLSPRLRRGVVPVRNGRGVDHGRARNLVIR
jgi:hypothetical protein